MDFSLLFQGFYTVMNMLWKIHGYASSNSNWKSSNCCCLRLESDLIYSFILQYMYKFRSMV